jgi:hypothetical protein
MPAKTIGKYRRARLIKKGYAVRTTHADTGAVAWPLVTHALHILAPLKVTRLTCDDGSEFGCHSDDDIMCRTPSEVAKAAEAEKAATP